MQTIYQPAAPIVLFHTVLLMAGITTPLCQIVFKGPQRWLIAEDLKQNRLAHISKLQTWAVVCSSNQEKAHTSQNLTVWNYIKSTLLPEILFHCRFLPWPFFTPLLQFRRTMWLDTCCSALYECPRWKPYSYPDSERGSSFRTYKLQKTRHTLLHTRNWQFS